ncbi:hypothetical protein GGP66_000131 [Salinibacter ruber]|nr:hypothetical protein [Salinibacter ruber]
MPGSKVVSLIATSADDQSRSLCTTFDPSLAFSPIISSCRARLKFMARFTSALLKLRASNLWEIATALKAGVKEESNYRRIRRFLSDYEVGFAELGRLLMRLLPQNPPYKVVLDRTEWHFGSTPVNVLMVGIAHKGIAFPISWMGPAKRGEVPRQRITAGRSSGFSRWSIQKTSRSCSGIGSLSQLGGFVGSKPKRFRLRFACDRIEKSGCLRKALRFRPECSLARFLSVPKRSSTERVICSEPTGSMSRCRSS